MGMNNIVLQIDAVLHEIGEKHKFLEAIRCNHSKQLGRIQYDVSLAERLQQLHKAERKSDENISLKIDALNNELSKEGLPTIINIFKKGN